MNSRVKKASTFVSDGETSPTKKTKVERDLSGGSSQESKKSEFVKTEEVFKILGKTCTLEEEVVLIHAYNEVPKKLDEVNVRYRISHFKETAYTRTLLQRDETTVEIKSLDLNAEAAIEKIDNEGDMRYNLPEVYQVPLSVMPKCAPKSKDEYVSACFHAKVIQDIPLKKVVRPDVEFFIKSYIIEDEFMSRVTVSSKGDSAKTFDLELGKTYQFYFMRLTSNDYLVHGFELSEIRYSAIDKVAYTIGSTHIPDRKVITGEIVCTNSWSLEYFCRSSNCNSSNTRVDGKILYCNDCGNKTSFAKAKCCFKCNLQIDGDDSQLYNVEVSEQCLPILFGTEYKNLKEPPLETVLDKKFTCWLDATETKLVDIKEGSDVPN